MCRTLCGGASNSLPVLRLSNVSKYFGPVRAVEGISFEVAEGEILTLLGPSGCGKTTTLRLVVGLERCDEGEIMFEGSVVDSAARGIFVPPNKRNMGMVFQSYAIWPHMTVFENVAYPLRVRHVSQTLVRERVARVLAQVDLTDLQDRPATQLSGGQQQRVALARSLASEPRLLLLDEPFSNLDARLRERMRGDLKVLQRRLGISVLLVTHDQMEALSVSDRIAVVWDGRLEQVGSPEALYRSPLTPHVRDFLGRTIVLQGTVAALDTPGSVSVRLSSGAVLRAETERRAEFYIGQACSLATRPEMVEVEKGAPESLDGLGGRIEAILFTGERYEARVRLDCGQQVLVYLPAAAHWAIADRLVLRFPPAALHVWTG